MILEFIRRMKERLANSFAALSTEADGDRHDEVVLSKDAEIPIQTGEVKDNDMGRRKSKDRVNGSATASNAPAQVASWSSDGGYKLPLVWIDLEMTGLNVEVERILEVACIITDGKLTKSVEGPNLVIHQTKDCLDKMGEWCREHHGASGLTKRVLASKLTEKEAEKQLIEFVKKHVGTYTPLLAGNSVYTDFIFLKKYMPELAALFSHVIVDVSSIKALCKHWFIKDYERAPVKENKHRALDDIRESIQELKYYKANIFKPERKK